MSETLFVCSTCDRYHPAPPGSLSQGSALRARLVACLRTNPERSRPAITIRSVECLNGCPRPCNAALRAPGKTLIRFFKLAPEDAEDVLSVAHLYGESRDGRVAASAIPVTLRGRVSQSMIHIPSAGDEESIREQAGVGV